MPDDDGIHWPPEFAEAPVQVSNEILIEAPPDKVWAWLIRAARWPEWYPNSANVKFDGGSGPDLQAGTKFWWKTFSASIVSTVREFIPGERISWDGNGLGVRVYHAWLLQKVEGRCRVLTEERQFGFLCRLDHWIRPNRMHDWHQLWLERLQEKARGGPPA
jgi:uncharacterized protein YndB with AHSA1/START domain